MRSLSKTLTHFFSRALSAILVICLVFTTLSVLPVNTAFAEEDATSSTSGGTAGASQNTSDTPEVTADTPMPNIAELQKQVDEASAVYDEASQRILEIEKEIAFLDERIRDIQLEMPSARKVSNEAARAYYQMLSSSNPILELFLGATSLADFFAKFEYSTRVNQRYLDDIAGLSRLNTSLDEARAELATKKANIEDEEQRAEEALLNAQHARDVAEETALKIAEATAAATAAAAEAAAAAAHTPQAPIAPNPMPDPTPPVTPTPPGATPEAPSDKQAFVDLWAPRIDAYLAGSPLAGYGYAFANAAYDYNIDPRWSPAIACLESSKGRYCFLPYNAWGWGHVSWPDWETAIYAHIRGLSIGYGYTISEAYAKKYCPPNWEYWYSFVSNQMTLI
jgi:peptidoglycan hydrolase CwlO-like protein